MDFDILNETITPLQTTLLTLGGTGAVGLPAGTTIQRPGTVSAGAIRWNTSLSIPEYFNGTIWVQDGGSVSSVAISGGTTGLTTSGGPITSSGTITLLGTLGIANGGTGQITASAAYNALSPMTTTGDLEYYSPTGSAVRLAIGTNGQVLAVSSGIPTWTTVGTASYSVNVGPAGSIAWSLISGTTYNAIITHNLGTQNVVVQTSDISNNNIVVPDLITITSSTQITVQVSGTGSNLKTVRVVVIANGASIAAGGSTPSSVLITANGASVSGGPFTTINFTGYTNTPTGTGGTATINLGTALRTLSYFATSLDSPNNSDWAINSLAPTTVDPSNAAIDVRQFSNTVEQGVGLFVSVPSGATNITFTYKGRSASATAGTLQMRFYSRAIASSTPSAVSSWSAANNLASVSSPANIYYQTFSYTATLSSLSLSAGNMYQFEFTRNIGIAGNLAFNWYLVELDIIFT